MIIQFEQVDKRFEQVNSRLESQFYLIIAGFTLMLGYLLKERTSIVKQEIEPELVKKADKNVLDKIIAIIEEMAKKDKDIEKILTKHNMKLV